MIKRLRQRFWFWNHRCDNVFFETKIQMHLFCAKWAFIAVGVILLISAWIYFLVNINGKYW